MDETSDKWWYCLKHNLVEHGAGCPNAERLGPFESEREAGRALEIARKRNEAWDEADDDWESGGGAAAGTEGTNS